MTLTYELIKEILELVKTYEERPKSNDPKRPSNEDLILHIRKELVSLAQLGLLSQEKQIYDLLDYIDLLHTREIGLKLFNDEVAEAVRDEPYAWVMIPARPTEEMIAAASKSNGIEAIYKAMLTAAPHPVVHAAKGYY